MRCSRQDTNSAIATSSRHAPRWVVNGLSALVGLGLCLGLSPASADQPAQSQAPQQVPGAHGPRAGAQTTRSLRIPNKDKTNLMIAGAATLGGFWTVSAITAGISALHSAPTAPRSHQQSVLQGRHAQRPHHETELLIPLVGPWISVATHRHHSPAASVGLTTLGIGQAVGLGMLIGGISMSKDVCVRAPLHKEQVLQMRAAPVVSPGGVGLELHGTF